MSRPSKCRDCGRRHIDYWGQLQWYWRRVLATETPEQVARSLSHLGVPMEFKDNLAHYKKLLFKRIMECRDG